MFEVFGPLARPMPSVLPLVLALAPLLGLLAACREARLARQRALAVCALGAVAAGAALVWSLRLPGADRFLLGHAAVAARVGQLDLVLALALDPLGAFASMVVALVTVRLLWTQRRPRRIALLCVASAATQCAVMADGATTFVLAAGIASLVSAAAGYVQTTHFVADRIADVAIVLAAAVTFWVLGGSWIGDQYVPELEARVVVATDSAPAKPALADDDDDERAPALHKGARAGLSLSDLPGAAVLVDGVWLRSHRIATSPFLDVPIAAGTHTLRVHVGAGSDDYFVPRMNAIESSHVTLAARGSTTTFRALQDDLVERDAGGGAALRDALTRRRFFGGVSAAGLVLALLAIAFAARSRLFPFAPSRHEPARALAAFASVVLLARFPFGELVPSIASMLAAATALAALVTAANALTTRTTPPLLATEIALAGAACIAGSPAVGVAHAAVACVVLARARAPGSVVAQLAFLPTRIAIVGACAAHGAMLPAIAAIVVTWLAASALARFRGSASRGEHAAFALGTLIMLGLAIDPRTFGASRDAFVRVLFEGSFRSSSPGTPPAVAIVVLTAAIVAFAHVASRGRALDRLATSGAIVASSNVASVPSRVIGGMVRAAVAALVEIENALGAIVRSGERVVEGAGAAASFVDDTLWVAPTRRMRMPSPSERVARIILVPVALVGAASFVWPWLS